MGQYFVLSLAAIFSRFLTLIIENRPLHVFAERFRPSRTNGCRPGVKLKLLLLDDRLVTVDLDAIVLDYLLELVVFLFVLTVLFFPLLSPCGVFIVSRLQLTDGHSMLTRQRVQFRLHIVDCLVR